MTELSTTSTQRDEHDHVGMILVAKQTFEEMGITIDLITTQGQLRDTGTFERIKTTLLLPASYRVIAVIVHNPRVWRVFVESDDVPLTSWWEFPLELVPVYTRIYSDEPETTTLTKIMLRRADGSEEDVLREVSSAKVSNLRGQPLVAKKAGSDALRVAARDLESARTAVDSEENGVSDEQRK